ncbi:hypothetical protein JAAARDRAFT_32354 [Jaapia argillacea MUCL 33604]|uniref:Oxysterol-binding protein n=1 Tax=Jaapia argillacea MUCL 33604 TaxID=933084 RepID=A0A067Q1H7_9AGAM|nr:hypothetical protein JAAARDRAFT_32354 [Jaapia argillacea MUCL 33604]
MPPSTQDAHEDEHDLPGPPIVMADSGDHESEGGKLKMIVQLVKKCLGVKDIAAMRLSLPASLLEPIPNLEYWHYLDRPDLFAAINDSEDAFERMLAVIRFTFTKDLKFIRGKVCKPYNSVLGEHFRCSWDVIPVSYTSDPMAPPTQRLYIGMPTEDTVSTVVSAPNLSSRLLSSESASVKSGRSAKSAKSTRSGFSFMSSMGWSTPATSPGLVETNLDAQMSNLSLDHGSIAGDSMLEANEDETSTRVRIIFLTEQVSHHPPISAFYAACPSRSVEMTGIDQISAKVSGTSVKVAPGSFNKGIFIRLTGGAGEGEVYQVTHPVASVNGLLRGNFYVTIGESTIITCTGKGKGERFRAILEYKEESWLGKAHYAIDGVIHTYTEGEEEVEEWTRVKHVPQSRIIAVLDGSWKTKIRWRYTSSSASSSSATSSAATSRSDLSRTTSDTVSPAWATLIDLTPLYVIPKTVRPLERQLPDESRKLWENVTYKLLKKEFSEATRHKQAIEQKQRDDTAERKRKGIEFAPKYFDSDLDSGVPLLTEHGKEAVDMELKEPSPYPLEGALKNGVASKS